MDKPQQNLGQLVDTWEQINHEMNIVIGVLAAITFGVIGFALAIVARCSQ